jgi:hypothetical protein
MKTKAILGEEAGSGTGSESGDEILDKWNQSRTKVHRLHATDFDLYYFFIKAFFLNTNK